MKIRNGFVSNSSSSSFLVAWNGELTEEKVLKSLDVNEKSPLYDFAKDLAKFIVNEEKTIYQSYDKYKEDCWSEDDRAKSLFDKGLTVAEFSASYNEYNTPIEGYLGGDDYFKIISDDFILLGEYAEF